MADDKLLEHYRVVTSEHEEASLECDRCWWGWPNYFDGKTLVEVIDLAEAHEKEKHGG